MKSEKELHTSKPSSTADVYVDPKARRDITLHLDLDVTKDVEEELEEFSKLRRIGHFKAAKRYFEEHLKSCIDNAYVLDQYGQFLLETSDVHTLNKLVREYPAVDSDTAASANWSLICERALQYDDNICPQGKWRKTPSLRSLLRNWPDLDSTENENAQGVIRVIQEHWKGSAEDEVTSLALLDIFTLFTMWALDAASIRYEDSLDDSEELQTAKMYLKIAHHYATEVLRQNPLNLKSRPYLQWVVAKVLVETNTTARCGQAALAKFMILRALSTRSYEKTVYLNRAQDLEYDTVLSSSTRGISLLRRERIYATTNNGQQAIGSSGESSSGDFAPSDDDDTNQNGPWSVRLQRSSLDNVVERPKPDAETTALKKEVTWLEEQLEIVKGMLAIALKRAHHAELMSSQPAVNTLPKERDSMEKTKDFEPGRKDILGSDSRRTTKESGGEEDIINLVDNQDKQRRGEEENEYLDDPDAGGVEVERLEPQVYGKEGKQQDVQSMGSQDGNHEASPRLTHENSDGPRWIR
ncbi:hypothetical protein CCHR01_12629 [Colletotrichum chrysophilum]|uniref:Uncharacterized protein n=1 Tax=Colletotrichum chrysophilum TaxID=1836956 RepID=A0AAD9AAY9_9PEZI|nr:hypothetical protein CCHR01_12629 [Colletotrichum chrysophilum]